MILRRVMAHLRKQEWTAIAIDFVIVVLGVFLGLQVSNWNEAAADRRALGAAIGRLQAEMAANIETMDVIDGDVQAALPVVQAAADALVSCRDDVATGQTVNAGLPRITVTAGLRLRHSAIDELTSDPRLLSLQSPELRRRLADVRFYTDLAEERALFYEQAPLEARVEENRTLRLGPRQRVTASYFGIDYSKDRRPLELDAPVSVACRDHALVNAFNTWERWQQNLPVLGRISADAGVTRRRPLMILRRVMEHLRKQEWTAIGIDFVIVVLGVFLGIQVSNWNQAAADRRAESAYLSQLQGDLQRIEAEVSSQVEFEQFQGRLVVTVGDLIASSPSADRSRKISMALTQLTMRRTLRTESPTFTDLQSSGNLEIITDPELRAAIITYFFSARRLEAVIDKNNGYFVDEGFVQFMREQGLPVRPWDDQVMGVRVPSVGRTDGPFEDEIYTGRLFSGAIPALTNAPSASAWAPVVSQLSWRGLVAVSNESTARRLLDATNALEARIADRLGGGRS